MIAQGTVLLPEHLATSPRLVGSYPETQFATLDPRNAMSQSLMAFLMCAKFYRNGGTGPITEFVLQNAFFEWPDASVPINWQASASVVDTNDVPYEAHSFTPTPLEETANQFGDNTVLWKTGEAVASFQVDFWAADVPTREAMAARLPALFNPGESRTGVILAGSDKYFCRPVRATLLQHQRIDNPDSVYSNERRLMTIIQCEIDVVHLRCVAEINPQVNLAAVGETVKTKEEPAIAPLEIGCDCNGG